MRKPYTYEFGEESYTLEDSIEFLALDICKCVSDKEQRTTEVMQKCKILDSLSNALLAIKK